MPFKFRWPFRWPRRKLARDVAPESDSAPLELARPTAGEAERQPASAAAQVTPGPQSPDILPGPPGSLPPGLPEAEDLGEADLTLGRELLDRLDRLSTPPTLGRLGGLPAMAQALPAVDHFLQQLPAAPIQRALEGTLSRTDDFAASLAALSSYGGLAGQAGAPAFPEELWTGAAQTDVLPPLGSLPGQTPAISGQAPILTPSREPTAGATGQALPPPITVSPEGPPPATQPEARPAAAAAPEAAGRPAVAAGPPGAADRTPAGPPAPMTQVLPVESTLTGNVLSSPAAFPVQRALAPYTPAWSAAELFAGSGEIAGERVTPEQRAAIESQRGQGQPLQPEVRQRFEAAYGASLAEVRVHTGQAAHRSAQSLNAIAFASGRDIFFGQDTFQPASSQGLGLIGHELAHVVQQRYGIPGDTEALRPPGDAFERQAQELAAAAIEMPGAAVTQSRAPSGAPVQRAVVGDFIQPDEAVATRPEPWARATAIDYGQPPPTAGPAAEPVAPIQRFGLGNLGSLAQDIPAELPELPRSLPQSLPSLEEATGRVSGLMDQLPSAGGMLSSQRNLPALGSLGELGNLGGLGNLGNLGGLAQSLPGLGDLSQGLSSLTSSLPGNLAQNLAGGLPALGSLPGGIGGLAENLPMGLGSLPQLAGGMPSLGSLAQGLGGALPSMPQLPGLGEAPGLGEPQSLSGLQLPEMPLTEGLGGLTQAPGGAAQAGQAALGSITSMAPSPPETPAAPPLPSLEKLTEHIWKQVQHKLKVERERSRGLA